MKSERIILRNSIVILVVTLLTSVWHPEFLRLTNILGILQQSSVLSIVATGMTYVIIVGGIDLSVGAVVALSGIVLGLLLKRGWSAEEAVIISLLVGITCGTVNGVLVTLNSVPPFIATLGMLGISRGL